jgi:protein-glutamine gamma-glutamyltransferase
MAMIKVSDNIFTADDIKSSYPKNNLQNAIAEKLYSSSKQYNYNSTDELKFELDLRAGIVAAARMFYKSKVAFKVFRDSMCNSDFWERTPNGGFMLKKGVKPSDAINDIFTNGRKYGTECATAIVIIYYKAILDVIHEYDFNQMFPSINLMDWYYTDSGLGVQNHKNAADYLPGDCRYFTNPDVNPTTPEWQGENVIDLGDGTYFGHGLGMKNDKQIISALNTRRKSEAAQSAYLMDSASWPDFKQIFKNYKSLS